MKFSINYKVHNGASWLKVLILALIFGATAMAFSGCSTPASDQKNPQDASPSLNLKAEDINSLRFAKVVGQVEFSRQDKWIKAVKGMQLNLSDILATGSQSEADLDVDANKHILVGEQVRMILSKLVNKVGNAKVATLKLDTGAIYVRIQKKLESQESFEVITPTCVMGVRGTRFVVQVEGAQTSLWVIEGQVAAQIRGLDGGSTESYEIEAGHKLVVPLKALHMSTAQATNTGLMAVPFSLEELPPFVLTYLKDDSSGLSTDQIATLDQALATSTQNAGAGPWSGDTWVDAQTGKAYARVDTSLSFESAKAECQSFGGHLMTIGSQQEQAIAEKLLAGGTKIFYTIGLYQETGALEPNAGFVWVTGEPLAFERWHRENGTVTEPNNAGAGGAAENEVTIVNGGPWPRGDWNDQNLESLGQMTGYLCEWASAEAMAMGFNPLKPYQSDLVNYDLFLATNLNDPIQNLTDYLGIDLKVDEGDQVRYIFRKGEAMLSAIVKDDRLVFVHQEGLYTASTALDLKNINVHAKLMGLTTLAQIEAFLGTPGALESKILTDEGHQAQSWTFTDPTGYMYVATYDVESKTISHSYRGAK